MTDNVRVRRQFREVTVVAQNPSVRVRRGRQPSAVLTTRVRIVDDIVRSGPRGSRLHVVDLDTTDGSAADPFVIDWDHHERVAASGRALRSRKFRTTNIYAIAANVVTMFEQNLGRRVAWSFPSPQLFLVPEAFVGDNAYYSPEKRAVLFGYVGDGRARQWTALSRDVVSHEVTHAILDGLRPRWLDPALPDQAALHEGIADIVALLSVLSSEDVVTQVLARYKITTSLDGIDETCLFDVAGAESTIRSSLATLWKLSRTQIQRRVEQDTAPHRRCELVVAAVCATVVAIWRSRCEHVQLRGVELSRPAIAQEGAKAAGHVLGMVIRALDYLPSVEVDFSDFLDAIIMADEDLAPDDELDYRAALKAAFTQFGIGTRTATANRSFTRIVASSDPRTLDAISRDADNHALNFAALATDPDEVYRFIWQNPWILHPTGSPDAEVGALNYQLDVDRVRASVRTGPDGLVRSEVFADYTQTIDTTVGELRRNRLLNDHDGTPPAWLAVLDAGVEIRLRGGGVLVFGQFGNLRLIAQKRIDDWDRQRQRLAYLVTHDLTSTKPRFGFSYGGTTGAQFQALHNDTADEETW